MEMRMNTDILSGMWKQLKGEVKQNWGKLTDDDITQISGSRDKLVGMLQERYGWSKAKADEEVNSFLSRSDAELKR
jgi:uncharacterized protein YjbJ (UPF0337 family)